MAVFSVAVALLGLHDGTTSGGSGDACDACGASSTYSETVATQGGYSKRTITASGCPNHYSYHRHDSHPNVCQSW